MIVKLSVRFDFLDASDKSWYKTATFKTEP